MLAKGVIETITLASREDTIGDWKPIDSYPELKRLPPKAPEVQPQIPPKSILCLATANTFWSCDCFHCGWDPGAGFRP